jgi:RHS repeat-associated protein
VPVDDGTYEVMEVCESCLPGYPCLGCYNLYVWQNSTADGVVDRYTAVVITANDYYPFGMMMPGRKYSADGTYRYGFNGKENDNEVKGEGNQQDYGMRIYNPRLGRFLSVDPLAKKFAFYSPYQYAGNKPIWCIDLDGLEDITFQKSLQNRTSFKVAYETTLGSGVIQETMTVIKKQTEFDVVFVEFNPLRTFGGGVATDYGWEGNASVVTSKADWQKDWVAHHIPFSEIEQSINSGKSVIVVGISQYVLSEYDNLTDQDVLEGKDLSAVLNTSSVIAHEFNAHVLGMIKGTHIDGATDHELYNGIRSNYSPENRELFTEPKYSKSKAAKDVKKLWKYIMESFIIDQFDEPKSNPKEKNSENTTVQSSSSQKENNTTTAGGNK